MFTSRAEFRLMLRQDNAVRRLGPVASEAGLLTTDQENVLARRLDRETTIRQWFVDTVVKPSAVNPLLAECATPPIEQSVRAAELLKRPQVSAAGLAAAGGAPFDPFAEGDAVAAVEVELKYAGYIKREVERADSLRAQADFVLAADLPYETFVTVSSEAREKLSRIRPESLAQAARIPGVSPSDLQNLILEVRRWRRGGVVEVAGD